MSFGTAITVKTPFEDTVDLVRAALAEQGFGVLTEIDVRATMKAKLDVDVAPYLILGACNPPLAHRALVADPSIGLLLPCNVVVREVDEGTLVEAINPMVMVDLSAAPELVSVAGEAAAKIAVALAHVKKATQ